MQERPEVDISICMVTYNQKKYVEQAIDSYLQQETIYSYEILVGDDASLDGTAAFVKSIYCDINSEKYNENVYVIEQKVNVGLAKNLYELYRQAKGKYIYGCAGDDWACSKQLLQKQAQFLDANAAYSSVSNWLMQVDADNQETGESVCDNREYIYQDWILNRKVQACGTGMLRNYFINDNEDLTYMYKCCRNNEEIPMWALLLEHGKHYIIPEKLLAYRYVNNVGCSNYNSTHKAIDMFEDYFESIINLANCHPVHDLSYKEIMIANDFLKPVLATKDIKQCIKYAHIIGLKRMAQLCVWLPKLLKNNEMPVHAAQKCLNNNKQWLQ